VDDSLGKRYCPILPRCREKPGDGKWWIQLPSFTGKKDIELPFQSLIRLCGSDQMKSTTMNGLLSSMKIMDEHV
jgi:hypothetical protein